ncbi:GTPase Era, mitochondrial [Hetaerina americana]|uniref:GTPase Era, mitochondrial n=1 Tax=Hetaerina americana TaxID=62018 RepID=UPI003A7F4B6B
MLPFVRAEIKCLWGSWKNSEFLLGLHYVHKLVDQNSLLKYNGLTSEHLVKRLCSFYPRQQTCFRQSAFGIEKDMLHESHPPDIFDDSDANQKLVKVAVIGTPNAGKSTLINCLVKRRVCSISSKVHTTRNKAKAIVNEGATQIIFLDTPGVVNASETKKHNLEKSFLVDTELCMEESDLVVVVHDISNIWTRDRLDFKVLRLLHLYHKKPSVLVMNKVDSLKSKRKLLDLTRVLTCGSLKGIEDHGNAKINCENDHNNQFVKDNHRVIPAMDIDKVVKSQIGWPYFENVFMISALKGDGVDFIKECILQKASPKAWLYPPSVFTDQKVEDLIMLAVREKLLDNLPQEIPYNIVTELEHANISPAGDVTAVVLVKCEFQRHAKMLLSGRGRTIKEVARSAEQALESTLMENVRLNLVVQTKK